MVKKNNKPYSNSNKKNMTRVKKNADIKKKITSEKDKSLDVTTKIRVDLDRLNDIDSLDTSFLEGRYNSYKKSTKKKKRKSSKKKNNYKHNYLMMKKVCYLLGTLTLALLVILFFVENNKFNDSKPKSNKKQVEEKVVKNNIVDDNYLLLGTYHTEDYDLDDFDLDYHYVKIANKDYEITDIIEDMKKNVYDFNPSIVFIELGINEIGDGEDIDEVLSSLEKLVNNIQYNRKFAEIYVESLYPINPDMDDYDKKFFTASIDVEDIKEYNKKIKKLTDQLNVHYLDIYKELNDDDKLNEKYTDDGIHLNNEGYKVINKMINSITGDRNEKEKD